MGDGHGAVYYKRNPTGNPPSPQFAPWGLAQGVPPGHLALRWNCVTGQVFALEYTTNLQDGFSRVMQSNIPATPPSNTFSVPMTDEHGFYRLKF